MCDLVHNFAARKRKHDASFKRAVDAILEVAGGEGPDVQAIVISSSPEIVCRPTSRGVSLTTRQPVEYLCLIL